MENIPNIKKHSRTTSLLLILIIILGAWLRIEATLKTQVDAPLRADALNYFSYAYNLRHYGIYSKDHSFIQFEQATTLKPDALSPPGYPFLLLPFASEIPTDKTVLHITLIQALLGILVIYLTYVASAQFLEKSWALLPCFLVAISPQLINCGVYVLTESLFTFLMTAAITCLAIQANRPENQLLTFFGGLFLGAATLTRPTLNYIIPFLLAALLPLLGKGLRWKWTITLIAGFLAIMLPWAIRNWLTLGGTDPTLAISALIHGHYPGAMYNGNPETLGYPYRFDPEISQISLNIGVALKSIIARVVTEPATYLNWYLIGKPLMFFSWEDIASTGEFFTYPTLSSPYYGTPAFLASKYVMQSTHYLWVIFAALTSLIPFIKYRDDPKNSTIFIQKLLATFFIYFVLIHMAGFPLARYSTPLLPITFMLATPGIIQALKMHKKRTQAQ